MRKGQREIADYSSDDYDEDDVVVNPLNTFTPLQSESGSIKKRRGMEIELGRSQDEPIEIRKPNYQTRTKGLIGWNPSILPKHFAMGIVGRPNAGKSHLLYELLTNPALYHMKFNRVLFITPVQSIGGINLVNCPYWSKNFRLDWIKQQLDQFNAEIRKKYPKDEDIEKVYGKDIDPFNVLIIMDDCVGELRKYQFDEYLKGLVFNRRHQIIRGCVSLIFTTQYYVRIPRDIRANMNAMIIFNCTPEDWNRVQNETVYRTSQISAATQKAVDEVFSQENAFIYINIDKGRLYQGFKEQIIQNHEAKMEQKSIADSEKTNKRIKQEQEE